MKMRTTTLAAALPAVLALVPAFAGAETIRIATIESLTGTFAPIGQNRLETFQFMADLANANDWAGADNDFEVTGFDGKASPQESVIQLKRAIDQGYRYIGSGNGSNVAFALVDAVNKHNSRNPGKEVILFNYSSIDPDLTNSKCSFYAFHFDSNTNMKIEVMANAIKDDPDVKKVFIIGQDYSHGHQVSRAAKDALARLSPDVEVVGDDLHPVGSVKDFAPYIAKIKASGADTVITGNWGSDLALLVKAAESAGVKAKFYTFYANNTGSPTSIGASGADRVKVVTNWHSNADFDTEKGMVATYKEKFDDDLYMQYLESVVGMLGKAVQKTGSLDPVENAFAMEGMTFDAMHGEVEMRADDHQLQQPLYVATWTKTDGGEVKYDQENTGYGWKTDTRLERDLATQPTTCEMDRPQR
ncbi:branched-chain amino acid ABC transporter substrate-binding protein [Paracoccus jeotgali]|uniref:Branched-chain amino acid ABC transporter substrate-binding protein n=1 Tax=Paracoccus jeotgali TaxID=2065379 RepID=A0A2K9MJP1_9RHOB|nr:branched-chain amino acid ABC transporter substrate-binding protein [Paracoccus jeotgali]AUM75851.1 branched-chain amino acid ABC transporter substrate-binding protein [Paracoccus jeotgali]